jgi:hypothetical protein
MKYIKIVAAATGLLAISFLVYLNIYGHIVLNYKQVNDNVLAEVNTTGTGGSFSPGNSPNVFNALGASLSQQRLSYGDGLGGSGGSAR